MTCPICLRETSADPCECGYAFETGDRSVALARAERVRRRAARQIRLGLAMFVIAIPVTVFCALLVGTGAPFIVPLLAELAGGVGWLQRGFGHHRAAQARIARSTQAELPPARIIPK
jgi:hypothetical protein